MRQKIDWFKRKLNQNLHLKEVLLKANKNLSLRLIGNLFSYLIVFIVIRLYGPGNYGQWSHSLIIFLVFRLISNLGIKAAAVRAFSDFYERESDPYFFEYYKKVLLLISLSSLVFSLSLYFGSDLIAELYGKQYLANWLKILSFGLFPANIIDLHSSILKGLRKIELHTFFENIGNPLFTIFFIGASFYIFSNFQSVFVAYIVAFYVLAALSFIAISRSVSFTKLKGKNVITYSEILSVSLAMLLNSSLDLIGRWADILILGFYCSEVELGAYHLVSRLANTITIPLQALNSIITPKYRQLFQMGDMKALANLSKYTATLTFFLALLPTLIFFLIGKMIIALFDSTYAFALSALLILASGQLACSVFGSVLHFLNMSDGHLRLMRIHIVATIVNVVLNLGLIPFFGLEGAAIATAFSLVLTYFLSYWVIKQRFGFSPALSIPGFWSRKPS